MQRLALCLACTLAVAVAHAQELRFPGDVVLLEDGVSAFGQAPRFVLIDLDGDGLEDALVARGHESVSVLRGRHDGGFEPWTQLPTTAGPRFLAVGDLDNDGRPDLVATLSDDSIALWLGQDGGTFQSIGAMVDVGGAGQFALSDTDGDGNLDLLQPANLELWVRHGLGDGLFNLVTVYPMPSSALGLHIADLDADGHDDVLVPCEFGRLVLLRGQGAAGLAPPEEITQTFTSIRRTVTGHMNADAHLDIVVQASTLQSSGLAVLVADGHGGFLEVPGIYHLPSNGGGLDLGDMDGNGTLDAVLGHVKGDFTRTIAVQPGNGHGRLLPPMFTEVAVAPEGLRLSDRDRDGRLDVVAVDLGLQVHAGLGDGRLAPVAQPEYPGAARGARAVDVDHDDRLDVLAINHSFRKLFVALGLGAGSLAPGDTYELHGHPESLLPTDLDDDGHLDILITTSTPDRLLAMRGDGAGGFEAAWSEDVGPRLGRIAHGDVDGDGHPDVVVVQHTDGFSPGGLQVVPGLGHGQFGEPTLLAAGNAPVDVALADLDGDGRLDGIVGNAEDDVVTVLMHQPAGPLVPVASFAFPPGVRDVELADLDGDGHVDMLVASETRLCVRRGYGGAVFGFLEIHPVDTISGRFGVGDLDGDGDPDVAVPLIVEDDFGDDGLALALFRSPGDGSLVPAGRYALPLWAHGVMIGDFDGDHRADLLAHHSNTHEPLTFLAQQTPMPWVDLGMGLGGAAGTPSLVGSGDLVAGQPVGLVLHRARPHALAWFVLSGTNASLPFAGGTLVPDPAPPAVVLPLPTDALGQVRLSDSWPPGVPAGLELHFQAWVADESGPQGWTASNALRAVTP